MKLFCPSCGAALEFRYDDSFVRVCPACRSAIVRSDRGIDSFGQFADLPPAGSGLSLGDSGRFQGSSFLLEGRASYRHVAGGTWEEWYLKLSDGRWAWLSQAAGEWVITFPSAAGDALPTYERLAPGAQVAVGGPPPRILTVGECNQAALIGAEGELPFTFTPGAQHRYADLSDGEGRFATLDYDEPGHDGAATLYLGRRVTLSGLGLVARVIDAPEQPSRAGRRLGCPHCGGSLTLRVPDKSLCVTCEYCGSLLDCEGDLAILSTQAERAPASPIALGAAATFEGTRYVVSGRLRREASYDEGSTFAWDEYLLYAPAAGYRWLSCARGHYTFMSPLPAGAVKDANANQVTCDGTRFRLFDRAEAEVRGVWGEFYWKVQVGERVLARDFIAPPALLSSEQSERELHWTLGVYQSPAQIQAAFDMKELRDERSGVAANQPCPHRGAFGAVALLAVAFLLCTIIRVSLADARQVDAERFELDSSARVTRTADLGGLAAGHSLYVFFSREFELSGSKNVEVGLELPLQNSWAYFTVDLVHEASGELKSFGRELSHYSGTESGERWSEGGTQLSHVLGAGRSGRHLLRIEVQTPEASRRALSLVVTEDVFPWSHFTTALLALAIPSALLLFYRWMFERARWSESDYAPAHYGSSGGNDD